MKICVAIMISAIILIWGFQSVVNLILSTKIMAILHDHEARFQLLNSSKIIEAEQNDKH